MKTLTDLKRRISVGARIRVIQNTKRPELNGTERTVSKVQGNGFFWTMRGEKSRCWTEYPKAAGFKAVDEKTFRLALFDEHFVELQFVG